MQARKYSHEAEFLAVKLIKSAYIDYVYGTEASRAYQNSSTKRLFSVLQSTIQHDYQYNVAKVQQRMLLAIIQDVLESKLALSSDFYSWWFNVKHYMQRNGWPTIRRTMGIEYVGVFALPAMFNNLSKTGYNNSSYG